MINELTHEIMDLDHHVACEGYGTVSSVMQQLAIISTLSKGDVILYNSSNVTLRDIGHGTKMQLPCLFSDLSHLLRRGDIIEIHSLYTPTDLMNMYMIRSFNIINILHGSHFSTATIFMVNEANNTARLLLT